MSAKEAARRIAIVFVTMAAIDIGFARPGWPISLFYAVMAMAIATIADRMT